MNKIILASLCFFSFHCRAFALELPPLSGVTLEERLAELKYIPWNGHRTLKETNEDSDCLTSHYDVEVIDPGSSTPRTIAVRVSLPNRNTPVPAVVIAPTILGPTELEFRTAAQLCDHGIATFVADAIHSVQPPTYPDWSYEDQTDLAAIRALRTTLDFAQSFPSVDHNRLGMMGLSLGGIITSMVAAVERDRLHAVVLVASSGNIPYALAYSTQFKIRQLREARMQAMGWTNPADYELKLRQTIRFDPNFFASKIRSDRMIMFMAEYDRTVPYISQQESYHYFGSPEQVLIPSNHFGALVSVTQFHLFPVIKFFQEKFDFSQGIQALQ